MTIEENEIDLSMVASNMNVLFFTFNLYSCSLLVKIYRGSYRRLRSLVLSESMQKEYYCTLFMSTAEIT